MVFAGGNSAGSGVAASEAFGFAGQVVRGRWFMVFACFLIMSASGATYIFSIYSQDIKSSLGYDQQTLNTLSFFKDLGANVGILSGLINEVTPPWVVLSLGSAMNLFGYLMIYLAITGRLARPAAWQMCVYICVGANSQSFTNTGALVTCVKNFPDSRGIVLGLLKGFVGLSGAIFTQLYLAFYGHDSKSLVLLVAWLPAAISIFFVHTIRIMEVVKKAAKENTKPFYCFLYISLALAAYLMVLIIVQQKRVTFSHSEYSVSAAVVIFLLFLPLGVVVKEELRLWRQKKEALSNPPPMSITVEKPPMAATIELPPPPLPQQQPEPTPRSPEKPNSPHVSRIARAFKAPNRGEDYTILQALVSLDMIILFFATICGVGGTLTAIDNMGQIGQSLGYPARSVNTFVSLISIWNYMGRVASGFLSEILLARYKFPRPLMLSIVLLLSCVGHLLIAFGTPGSLYFSSVIIGFCFGAQWPLLFAIISEIFGLKYYSTLYNFGGVASPIGLYILNVKVAGYLYDLEAAKQNHGVKESTCIGTHCFKLAFLIIAAVTVAGTLVSLILVWRTWNFYQSDIYSKFRADTADTAEEEKAGTSLVAKKEDRPSDEKNKVGDDDK
ncbi:uncharacterized protein M6B38_312130 [Iris pallida]|uniref:Nodulin-like domain-containing protein n=1 Tax=Iris pallida TaxID=29817 RepID=A0AAX6HG07_IRIPA|nr:uncharacterized protein M6B38_312130 [Iris pallida]